MRYKNWLFDLIAIGWMAIGGIDLLFLILFFAGMMVDEHNKYSDYYFLFGIAGFIICVAWIAACYFMLDRQWSHLTVLGIIAIIWGILHSAGAAVQQIALWNLNRPIPKFIVIAVYVQCIFSAFLVLSGLYAIFRQDGYREDHQQRIEKSQLASGGRESPVSGL
jgi:hypothetical protein